MSATAERILQSQTVFYPQCRVTLGLVFENFGDPKAPKFTPVLPTNVTVFSNSYKEADTWSIEFNAKDLPVTPELIRAGSCEIYLFQTPGIGQFPETIVAGDNDILDGLRPTIVGLFDEVSVDYSEGGRVVSIDGTDYTSLFLAKQWPQKKRVPSGKNLWSVLNSLKNDVESAEVMTLVVEPRDEYYETVAGQFLSTEAEALLVSKLPIVGRFEGRTTRKGLPVRDQDNYWDVMYDLAVRYGFILFVRGLDIILTKPKNYIEGKTAVKKMAWGRNLLALRMARKIGKEQVPTIEVRSYDEKRRVIVKGRYPQSRKVKPTTGLGTVKDEVRIYNVHGVRDQKQLEQIAETTYNLLARAEQMVEIETRDLKDLEGSDIIELAAGDALSIALEPHTTDLLEGQSVAQRIHTLAGLGFDLDVAMTIAETFDTINIFRRPFRVKEATLDWSGEGLHITAALQNYVDITVGVP